jgi:hypothetical protein
MYSGGMMSGRVLRSWPNLMNVGPQLLERHPQPLRLMDDVRRLAFERSPQAAR